MKKETESNLLTSETLKSFIFAGTAIFTTVNEKTGNRFTFRVRKAGWGTSNVRSDIFYVSVLTGSDNQSCYTFLGTFFGGSNQLYRHSPKSRISSSAISNRVIEWFFQHYIKNPSIYTTVKNYHSGKCGKCGRKLTTPDSIKSGLGPQCGNRV
jgi:hypothetical protein